MQTLAKLAEERRAIFVNVANGVPMDQVRSAFKRSQTEIDREIRFVARKIKEYRFRRRMPPLECDDIKSIRWNRLALLHTLRLLGPEYLGSELILPNITVQTLSSPKDLKGAAVEAGVRVN